MNEEQFLKIKLFTISEKWTLLREKKFELGKKFAEIILRQIIFYPMKNLTFMYVFISFMLHFLLGEKKLVCCELH